MLAILVKTIVCTSNNTLAKSIVVVCRYQQQKLSCALAVVVVMNSLTLNALSLHRSTVLVHCQYYRLIRESLIFARFSAAGLAYTRDGLHAGIYGKHLKLSVPVFDESLVSRRNRIIAMWRSSNVIYSECIF